MPTAIPMPTVIWTRTGTQTPMATWMPTGIPINQVKTLETTKKSANHNGTAKKAKNRREKE